MYPKYFKFFLQALTAFEKMNSKPSEPLVIEWPGAKAPALHRLPTYTSSNLRIGWEDPYTSEGVKIKHFRVSTVRLCHDLLSGLDNIFSSLWNSVVVWLEYF